MLWRASTAEGTCVRGAVLGLLALAIALSTSLTSAADFIVFGPETFRRDTATPVTSRRTFVVPKAAAPSTLRVTNDGVASAVVTINGLIVLGPSDFQRNPNVPEGSLIAREITLMDGPNELAVELRSKPGSSLTIEVLTTDAVPPQITTTISPATNANGWHRTPVTVHFTCADGESGIASCPPDQILSAEGAGQTVTGTAVDKSGNSTTVTSAPVSIDLTEPTIVMSLTPSPNEHGWSDGPVTATFTCVDSGSGVETCPADRSATDGISTITGAVTDRAGNTASVTSEPIRIDREGPAIAATVTPAPNAVGWNKEPVTVHFTCSDAAAGVAVCPADVVVTAEGADQSVTGTATDRAGNSAAAFVTVNIDRTAPDLVLSSPVDGATVLTPSVSAAGSVADALSGIAGVTCNGAPAVVNGGTLSCAVSLERGENTILATATDAAGNGTMVTRRTKYTRVPVITLTSPQPSSYLNISPTTVTGFVDDPSAAVMINSVPAGTANGSFSIPLPLAEGPNIITATATTAEGAIGTASLTVTLDTTPPHVTITSPPDRFVTGESSISVAGIVNDIVVGTVNEEQARVLVNGAATQVANRTFLAPTVPLELGTNVIEAVGIDRVGNQVTTEITVERRAVTSPQIRAVSGNNQSAAVGAPVSAPLVVAVTDALGNPVANQSVVFKVTQNDGTVTAGADSGPSVAVTTDGAGQARVQWTLGHRAGAGGNVVEAYSLGFEGMALFTATGTQGAARKIVVDTGNDQIGVAGEPLPKPLIAVVVDEGNNRLGGVPVTFTAIQGGGRFGGQSSIVVTTDPDGRAEATLTLGPSEGNANNFVQANFPGNPEFGASFTASGRTPGNPSDTTISGVVLDNSNAPIPGVTVRAVLTNVLHSNIAAVQTAPSAQTDAQGQFVIRGAPVGFVKLLVDGTTVQLPGSYPSLEYDMVTVSGRDNTIGQPAYLLPINTANQLCVTATTGGGTLTIPEAPGFSLSFRPGQVTFPGGSQTGCVSVTVVNGDKVPMVPGFGQQPRFIVTIQPAGAHFNPPATITLPNVDGLSPREVTEMYSFDHDIGSFVAIGTGVVSDDGLVIKSSPGVGVLKAGWHCGGNPSTTGAAANCPSCQTCLTDHCEADPAQNGKELPDDKCQVCQNGSPTPIPLNTIGQELAYTFAPPAEAASKINKELEKLKAIGIIASVNLLQITGKISEKECCDSSTGKGKGTEVSGSVTGDFGGFSVKGKVWPPGPIPFVKLTIAVVGLASLEAKGEFVGGVFIGLTGKVVGEIGYRKKDCSKDPADQAGCGFGKLEIGLTPSLSAEIGGSASLTFDCIFCDKTTIAVAASFMAGDLSWPISLAGVQYNVPKCSTGLTGGFLTFGDGKFKVSAKFSGSWKTTLTGMEKVDYTFTFVDCTINGSGVSCSFPF